MPVDDEVGTGKLPLDDRTPASRPRTSTDLQVQKAAELKLIAIIEEAHSLAAWASSLLHESLAGHICNWARERAEREADLRRRLFRLNERVGGTLP